MAGLKGRMTGLVAQCQKSCYHMITVPVKEKLGLILSSSLCKFEKGFSFPGAVEVRDDPEDDTVTTLTIGKAGDGAGATAHLAEGAFDHVGGAHLDPVSRGDSEKVQ